MLILFLMWLQRVLGPVLCRSGQTWDLWTFQWGQGLPWLCKCQMVNSASASVDGAKPSGPSHIWLWCDVKRCCEGGLAWVRWRSCRSVTDQQVLFLRHIFATSWAGMLVAALGTNSNHEPTNLSGAVCSLWFYYLFFFTWFDICWSNYCVTTPRLKLSMTDTEIMLLWLQGVFIL